jgi:HlyD family secretion protein
MYFKFINWRQIVVATVCMLGCATLSSCDVTTAAQEEGGTKESEVNSALSVVLISPEKKEMTERVTANGTIFPWQLVNIAAETNGVRVVEVLAYVGDTVKKGQLLARLDDTSIKIELDLYRAMLAEAKANLAQAELSAVRARKLAVSQSISEENLAQQETVVKTNEAKVAQAKAQVAALELRLNNTRIIAPDDGVIAFSEASVGALSETIGDMFKLIRQNRVEWRAELRPEQVAKIAIGQSVELRDPLGQSVVGRVRQIGPTVDTDSRISLAYVDFPASNTMKPGSYVSGDFLLDSRSVLTLPYSAVVVRDGFNYVMKVDEKGVVQPVKIDLSLRRGDIVEVLGGIQSDARVVVSGGAFLYAGDRVRVVDSEPVAIR